jgi:hypothetical protein
LDRPMQAHWVKGGPTHRTPDSRQVARLGRAVLLRAV